MRIRSFVFFGIVLSAFIAGAILGFYRGKDIYAAAYHFGILKKTKVEIAPIEQLLNMVFSDAVYEGQLRYDAIQNLSEIKSYPEKDLLSINQFDSAFKQIKIVSEEQLFYLYKGENLPVVEIMFEYLGKEYRSYLYGKISRKSIRSQYATLVIPGSGINQSSAIYSADAFNYHYGILEAIKPLNSDVFVLVKPNEDFLAIHNGEGKKVNAMSLINYHLNKNSSYSASYLLQAMAFVKWAKNRYAKTAIVGLSQGGAATLYIAVHSMPDIALISSGHSVLFNDVNIGGANQLLGVPGYVNLFEGGNLRNQLQNSTTNYFFSWGRREGDYYGIESSDKLTASWIEDLHNVDVAIHDGGHEFPVKEIQEYLIKVIE